ncbi:alpha/beta fold hydrolase [Acetobacter sp. DsW_063]|uniref:alpha/beta fold hydrolase n=1 Tax=Acetobacter sp. DsW_063 TaxID=1514894 RepID=UPI000A362E08|nr:alpha/beta fold hydrolase [Acetobacter sp. DsW_063]OUJ16752.1 esterase [Acetobacter sp. DsW_063]
MLLDVIERKPESGGGLSKPPVVFLHGLFGRARNFGFFQRRIGEFRRTLALDLRNHGDSPHGPADYPTMAEDVYETLKAHDAIPAVIVGHSMGGKTAMMLALRHPAAVERLLVADIAPGAGGFQQNHTLAAALAALPFPASLNRTEADALLSRVIPEADVRNLMLQNLRLGKNPGWTIGIHEIASAMPEIVGWPPVPQETNFTGRTLFVSGGKSRYIQPSNYPEMKHLFPHYHLETIPDAGHWLHAEKPMEFLSILEGFLNELAL